MFSSYLDIFILIKILRCAQDDEVEIPDQVGDDEGSVTKGWE